MDYEIKAYEFELFPDIDECNLPTKKPCDQICTNTIGAYSCSCFSGFVLDSTNSYSCLCKNSSLRRKVSFICKLYVLDRKEETKPFNRVSIKKKIKQTFKLSCLFKKKYEKGVYLFQIL